MMSRMLKQIDLKRLVKPIMPFTSWYMRVSPRMITCKEFNAFIFDYSECLLTEKQVKLFDRHMRLCPICRTFMETYVATYKAGKAFFPYSDEELPQSVPEDLLVAIRDVSDN